MSGRGEAVDPRDAASLGRFLDDRLGDHRDLAVVPMQGGGSCEIFALDRGDERWVLRRAPRHASSARAHDVLREFRILDAIHGQDVRVARPIVACEDPEVFGAPFYVMDRIDGVPVRQRIPEAWAAAPEQHGRALEELIDALVQIHVVDWQGCGLGDLAHTEGYLGRQIGKWLSQLDSYDGRELPAARTVADWLSADLPPEQPQTLCHGDYKLDNVLFAPDLPVRLLAVVDWEMAAAGDPLVDLGWCLIFHPGPGGVSPLGMAGEPRFDAAWLPSMDDLVARWATGTGRSLEHLEWYRVFSLWKLAVVLEGSYAKFLKGLSDKPVHEMFGLQVDRSLAAATAMIEGG